MQGDAGNGRLIGDPDANILTYVREEMLSFVAPTEKSLLRILFLVQIQSSSLASHQI